MPVGFQGAQIGLIGQNKDQMDLQAAATPAGHKIWSAGNHAPGHCLAISAAKIFDKPELDRLGEEIGILSHVPGT